MPSREAQFLWDQGEAGLNEQVGSGFPALAMKHGAVALAIVDDLLADGWDLSAHAEDAKSRLRKGGVRFTEPERTSQKSGQ